MCKIIIYNFYTYPKIKKEQTMYFPTSSTLIEFLILVIIDREDSYGYDISQNIKIAANIKESTLYPILKKA